MPDLRKKKPVPLVSDLVSASLPPALLPPFCMKAASLAVPCFSAAETLASATECSDPGGLVAFSDSVRCGEAVLFQKAAQALALGLPLGVWD